MVWGFITRKLLRPRSTWILKYTPKPKVKLKINSSSRTNQKCARSHAEIQEFKKKSGQYDSFKNKISTGPNSIESEIDEIPDKDSTKSRGSTVLLVNVDAQILQWKLKTKFKNIKKQFIMMKLMSSQGCQNSSIYLNWHIQVNTPQRWTQKRRYVIIAVMLWQNPPLLSCT